MASGLNAQKRYSLVLPEDLFNKIKEIADNRQTTVVDIIRKFMTLGLIATQDDVTLFIKREGEEKEESELLIL